MNDRIHRVFFPLLKYLKSEIGEENGFLWAAVCIWDPNQNRYIRPINCRSTTDDEERKKLYSLLREYEKQESPPIQPLSELVFGMQSPPRSVIVTIPQAARIEGFVTFSLQDLYLKFQQIETTDLTSNFTNLDQKLEDTCQLSEVQTFIAEFIRMLKLELGISVTIDNAKLSKFLFWLYLHDSNAKYWVYIPEKQSVIDDAGQKSGGVIICLSKQPTEDFLNTCEDLSQFYFKYLVYTQDIPDDGRSLPSEMLFASVLSKDIFLKYIDEIDQCIRDIHTHQDRLAEKENLLAFSPLYSVLTQIESFRWLSALGWHSAIEEPYRIRWDIGKPGTAADHAESEPANFWERNNQERKRFSKMANEFHKLLKSGKIISLNQLIFTRCANKKPLVVLYDQAKQSLFHSYPRHQYLEVHCGFVYCSFKRFYDFISPKIQAYSFRYDAEGKFNFDHFIRTMSGSTDGFSRTVLDYLKQEFYADIQKLSPAIQNEDDFLVKLASYLCWLVAHDLETKLVAYFPSHITPDIPSGGILVGFTELPSPSELIVIQEFVSNFLLAKGYLLSELVPDFPLVLSSAAFQRKFAKLADKAKKDNRPLSLAVIDLDHLKRFNDQLKNHLYGTLALRIFIVSIVEAVKEKESCFGKYGGDEFLLSILGTGNELQSILTTARLTLSNEEWLGEKLVLELQKMTLERRLGDEDFDTAKELVSTNHLFKELSFSAAISPSNGRDHPKYPDMFYQADKLLMETKNKRGFIRIVGEGD